MRGDGGGPPLDLTSATAAGGVVAWVLDLTSGRISWSEGLSGLLGLDPERLGSQAGFAPFVHPDDVGTLFEVIERAVEDSRPFRVRFRLVASGGWRWVEATGQRLPGEKLATGTMIDVTHAVAVEAEVFDATAHAQATLDTLGVVTWDWDVRRATVTAAIYGAEPWTAQLWDGMRPERAFLALFATEDRAALGLLVGRADPSSTLRLRLAPAVGGFPIRTRWRRRCERDETRGLLGVAVSDYEPTVTRA